MLLGSDMRCKGLPQLIGRFCELTLLAMIPLDRSEFIVSTFGIETPFPTIPQNLRVIIPFLKSDMYFLVGLR